MPSWHRGLTDLELGQWFICGLNLRQKREPERDACVWRVFAHSQAHAYLDTVGSPIIQNIPVVIRLAMPESGKKSERLNVSWPHDREVTAVDGQDSGNTQSLGDGNH